MSFDVHPGQVVALVGQSGGGKSTVVKLIEHFYELNSGRILLGISTVNAGFVVPPPKTTTNNNKTINTTNSNNNNKPVW